MQPKSQFSSGSSANKASAPESPLAQFEELNYFAQATQPKSQFNSGIQPRSLSSAVSKISTAPLRCLTQSINSDHAAKESIRNDAMCTGRSESGKIKKNKNKKRVFMKEKATYVLGLNPKKKKNKDKQAKIHAGDQTSEEGAEGGEGEWASAGLSGSPE